jgi:hypothetical protein
VAIPGSWPSASFDATIEPNLTRWNESGAVCVQEHGDQLPSLFLRRVRDQIELQPALAPAIDRKREIIARARCSFSIAGLDYED